MEYFNPRLYEEATILGLDVMGIKPISIHVSTKRRLAVGAFIPSRNYFNPRLYEEATTFPSLFFILKMISIHVSTKRRRVTNYSTGEFNYISIHVSTKRRRQMTFKDYDNNQISIHVSTKRRPDDRFSKRADVQFQSTSLRRGDIQKHIRQRFICYFNPRLYEEATILIISK